MIIGYTRHLMTTTEGIRVYEVELQDRRDVYYLAFVDGGVVQLTFKDCLRFPDGTPVAGVMHLG